MPMTTTNVWRASSKTMLATCGPRPQSTPGWTLLVSLGYMFVVRAHSAGGTWTLSTPNGCRRGTAGLVWARLWLVLVVGAMDADAQCTLCTGPWSSTGPVPCMVLSARCCATTGAVATLLVYAWLDSGYMFCVFTWVRYGRISHNFYVKAVLRS